MGDRNPSVIEEFRANATVEVGAEPYPVTARFATGDERERIWDKKGRDPGFADDEQRTTREIPIVVGERVR
jgi:hypothetical protein